MFQLPRTNSSSEVLLTKPPATICIFGAALDTGNLGVQALGVTMLVELRRRLPDARLIVFSGMPGHREISLKLPGEDGSLQVIDYEEIGCSLSRDPFKSGNLYVENALQRLGFKGRSGPVSRALYDADLILDVTGGDSFTSMYGPYRFKYATYPKRFCNRFSVPLVLMPQTYGPFDGTCMGEVRAMLLNAAKVWVRDNESAKLIEKLGVGVSPNYSADMAFILPTEKPKGPQPANTLIGVNVSGLLFHAESNSISHQYGLRCDYRSLMHDLVTALLKADSQAQLIFVPHVVVEKTHPESDLQACIELREILPANLRSRSTVIANPQTAWAAKGAISQCDFFLGTRMHACIAALSTGVPTCAIAYSNKTTPVFETVGMSHAVFDPRQQAIETIVEGVVERFLNRSIDQAKLQRNLPEVIDSVHRMFDDVVEFLNKTQLKAAA